jgi:nucleoid-associated protein YgaU
MSILDIAVGDFGALSKLTIKYEQKQRGVFKDANKIVALFNPNQLRYDNRAEWRAAGAIAPSIAAGFQRMEFQATPPATLAVDLFFDTYEGAPRSGNRTVLNAVLPDDPLSSSAVTAVDVTTYTSKVANLAHVAPELHRPPVCRLEWGKTTLFQGVLTQLQQDLTFFMPDGTPVRATLGCTFMAYRTFDVAAKDVELHSADVAKRRVVRRGDTLTSIAVEEYSDATHWRDIARENDIDDPRALAPGQVLVIPKVVA